MQTLRKKPPRTPQQELALAVKWGLTVALGIVIALMVMDARACDFHGGPSYRHNSTPGVERERYLFDGLGLSTWLDGCRAPVFVQFSVHRQMNETVYDHGDWRVDFELGWRWW